MDGEHGGGPKVGGFEEGKAARERRRLHVTPNKESLGLVVPLSCSGCLVGIDRAHM